MWCICKGDIVMRPRHIYPYLDLSSASSESVESITDSSSKVERCIGATAFL